MTQMSQYPPHLSNITQDHITQLLANDSAQEQRDHEIEKATIELEKFSMQVAERQTRRFLYFGVALLVFFGAIFAYRPELTADLIKVLGGAVIGFFSGRAYGPYKKSEE